MVQMPQGVVFCFYLEIISIKPIHFFLKCFLGGYYSEIVVWR